MIPVDAQTMREVAPHFSGKATERQAAIIAAVGEVLRPTLEGYGIATRLRIAHFLGQTCHESAGFSTTEEFASGEAYEGREDGVPRLLRGVRRVPPGFDPSGGGGELRAGRVAYSPF